MFKTSLGGSQNMKRLLTVFEAANYLGLQPSALRAWMSARKIPFVRVGARAVRIPLAVVEELIENGTVQPRPARSR
jgi:excisionase family DNA binding protein